MCLNKQVSCKCLFGVSLNSHFLGLQLIILILCVDTSSHSQESQAASPSCVSQLSDSVYALGSVIRNRLRLPFIILTLLQINCKDEGTMNLR